MDHDAACPGELVADLLPQQSRWMRFRIAQRAIEAWLLADVDKMATFLAVDKSRVPSLPDSLHDPKATLVALARQSRSKVVTQQLVPRSSGGRVGPNYSAQLAEFAASHWRPNVASKNSESLKRCLERVQELTQFRP